MIKNLACILALAFTLLIDVNTMPMNAQNEVEPTTPPQSPRIHRVPPAPKKRRAAVSAWRLAPPEQHPDNIHYLPSENLNHQEQQTPCVFCGEALAKPVQHPHFNDPALTQYQRTLPQITRMPCGHHTHTHCSHDHLAEVGSCPHCQRTAKVPRPPINRILYWVIELCFGV